jgi:CheY-like chemotaxis protein
MDHMMPGIDGMEATRLIRAIDTEYAKKVPIIALTANAVAGNEQMFLSNGFSAFLTKPINVMLLDSVVQRWVRDKSRE